MRSMPARYSSRSSTWKWPWTTGSFRAKWKSWYRFAPVEMTRSTKPASIIAWIAPPMPAGAIAPVTVSATVAPESIIRPKRSQPSASRPPLKAPARRYTSTRSSTVMPRRSRIGSTGGRDRYRLRRAFGDGAFGDWAMTAADVSRRGGTGQRRTMMRGRAQGQPDEAAPAPQGAPNDERGFTAGTDLERAGGSGGREGAARVSPRLDAAGRPRRRLERQLDEADLAVVGRFECEIGELRLPVDVQHPLLSEPPDRDHRAGGGVSAGVLAVEADVQRDRPLDRLDDVEEADRGRRARERVAAVRPAGRSDEPLVHEGLQ